MPIKGCNPRQFAHIMFFVEGDMEREAFRLHFGIRAKRIGINGDKVAVDAIARNISTDIDIAGNVTNVFIMFDREGRSVSSQEVEQSLYNIMLARYPEVSFKIVVPDRDTECWLFADVEALGKYFKKKIGQNSNFEGRNGVQALKRHVGPGAYEKMIDGVRLFAKVKWSAIRKRSASAERSELQEYFLGCDWFNR